MLDFCYHFFSPCISVTFAFISVIVKFLLHVIWGLTAHISAHSCLAIPFLNSCLISSLKLSNSWWKVWWQFSFTFFQMSFLISHVFFRFSFSFFHVLPVFSSCANSILISIFEGYQILLNQLFERFIYDKSHGCLSWYQEFSLWTKALERHNCELLKVQSLLSRAAQGQTHLQCYLWNR